MDLVLRYIAIILSGILTENILLTRGLDAGDMIGMINNPKKIRNFSYLFTITVTLSAVFCSISDKLCRRFEIYSLLKPTVYLVFVSVVYLIFYFIFRTNEKIKPELKAILGYACINSGVYGVMFIGSRYELKILESLFYSLGTGAGMFLVLCVILNARKTLKFSSVPRLFRGLPIILVYIGLLALGIFGLFGHPLPA